MRFAIIAALAAPLLIAAGATAAAGPFSRPAREASSGDRVREIIVKFESEGPHALLDCAETLFESGRAFGPATRDGSDSIDRVHRSVGVRRVRALFRRPDGRSLASQRDRLRARIGRRAGRAGRLRDLSHVYRVELSGRTTIEEAVARYAADAHVVYAQPNHRNALDQVGSLPNDPFLTSSGSWGQGFSDLWGLHRIRAPEAWAISRGDGVIVAVVDTGLDYDHPDIAENVWTNPGEDLNGNGRVDDSDWNGIDDDRNGFVDDLRGFDFANSTDGDRDGDYDDPGDFGDPDPFDDNGHGTHVAGTIAAVAGNGIGIAGVAPGARIMPLKGFPGDGPGDDAVLWQAVVYAIENGARVVNNSWSCSPACPTNPLAEDVVSVATAMDVVIVTSAGNRLTDVVFNSPENLPGVITVASTSFEDTPSSTFTNHGWLVDVVAPGGDQADMSVELARNNILSLRSAGSDPALQRLIVADDYLRFAGTSMATPHVSGVVALLQGLRPELSYFEIRRLLRQSALDLGPPGHDRDMGGGRIDALAALTYGPLPDLAASLTAPPQGSTHEPTAGAALEIRGTAAGDDLQAWHLHYGAGSDPSQWIPIVASSRDAVEDALLARLPIGELHEGAYVVRLQVHGVEGSVYSEFLQLSLERNEFERISSPGPAARAPDISGDLVVWQSRRGAATADEPADDLNLFATELSSGAEHVVQGGPGDQKLASIHAGLVSWIDERAELAQAEIFACALDPQTGDCTEFRAAERVPRNLSPATAAGRVFWVDGSTGRPDIHGCVPDRRRTRCDPFDLGLDPWSRVFLRSDGRTLAWSEAGGRLGTCRVDPRTGRCPRVGPAAPIAAFSRPAASGDLLAWVGSSFSGENPLQICELEPDTGACEPVRVAEGIFDTTPELSGNRLVWDAFGEEAASDVYFCEYDRVRRRCPAQRLTAQMAAQGGSAIDGRWVVFEDERDGAAAIFGLQLPALAPIADHRITEGRQLRIPVRALPRGRRGRAESLQLSAEAVGGESLASLGARFVKTGPGRGMLFWRPQRGQAGSYAVTFAGTRRTGLVTRQTIRIEVSSRRVLEDP